MKWYRFVQIRRKCVLCLNYRKVAKFGTVTSNHTWSNMKVVYLTINKYSKLIDLLSKNKDKGYGIIVLMILYMGRDKMISFVFKEILNVFFFHPSSNQDLGEGINKTNLIYMLAKKIIKHISLIESTKLLIIFVHSMI
jgi:hypothetical protein